MTSRELMIILIAIIAIVFILTIVVCFIWFLSRSKEKKPKGDKIEDQNNKENKRKLVAKEYTTESIFNFMEFDKIEDNMIVQRNGDKYLMVVECQGINYDLMSEPEKVAVEEGFVQFLNTLTHPIQIYTQTRTVNLEASIRMYQEKVKEIEMNFEKEKMQYEQMRDSGAYSKEQLNKAYYELTKDLNLCEYGKDIICFV